MTYDDYYWYAKYFLMMPPMDAHEWAEKQVGSSEQVDSPLEGNNHD